MDYEAIAKIIEGSQIVPNPEYLGGVASLLVKVNCSDCGKEFNSYKEVFKFCNGCLSRVEATLKKRE